VVAIVSELIKTIAHFCMTKYQDITFGLFLFVAKWWSTDNEYCSLRLRRMSRNRSGVLKGY